MKYFAIHADKKVISILQGKSIKTVREVIEADTREELDTKIAASGLFLFDSPGAKQRYHFATASPTIQQKWAKLLAPVTAFNTAGKYDEAKLLLESLEADNAAERTLKKTLIDCYE